LPATRRSWKTPRLDLTGGAAATASSFPILENHCGDDSPAAGYDAVMPGSYRFAARPRWIAGHVLAIVAIVGFVLLGFWQLRRHDQRRDTNSAISERSAAAPSSIAALLADFGDDPLALEFRRVRIWGRYRLGDEVLWQARTFNGQSGHNVLTPFLTENGAVMINRGWVPIDVVGPPVVGAEPEPGDVEIVGVIRRGQQRGRFGPIDPDVGHLDRVSRVDLARLQQQIDVQLYDFYVLLEDQSPPLKGTFPMLRPAPAAEAGPHLSYAVQWFMFAAVVAVGYPVLLRKTARDKETLANGSSSG
jgi:cytochrome oxidase assembly protein ShyY1